MLLLFIERDVGKPGKESCILWSQSVGVQIIISNKK